MTRPTPVQNLHKLFAILFLITPALVACGGDSGPQETDTSESAGSVGEMDTMDDSIRTINIIGIDDMKFAVEQTMDGITVNSSSPTASGLMLLESIEAQPGEEIRIRLTTRSQLPPSAMSHNWVLMVAGANGAEYVRQALQAADQQYLPQSLSDQVLAHTDMVGGGVTTEVVFTTPNTPGEYEYLCSFPGHYAAGMKGFLIVKYDISEIDM